MNDSYKVGHSRCPRCAKEGRDTHGDNLVEYSDGHTFCFACGYKTRNPLKHIISTKSSKEEERRVKEYHYSSDIPKKYKKWLSKYSITPDLISKYGIQYNETTDGLLFKLSGEGRVERRIDEASKEKAPSRHQGLRGVQTKSPKWVLLRKRVGIPSNNCWGTPKHGGICILVEDAVSGIRVSEVGLGADGEKGRPICCYPLLGTNINANDLYSLCRAFYGVGVWLDRDKRNHALKIASRASQWNANVQVICSEMDPKAYRAEEIRNFLLRLVSN